MMYIYRIKSDFLRNKTQVVTGMSMTPPKRDPGGQRYSGVSLWFWASRAAR
jgi:hypothetical protein